MNERHTEFFGPDLARGPFSSSRLETSVVQIATALAQLRVPLKRDDDEIIAHAEFIRTLAEALAPDVATSLKISTSDAVGAKATTFRTNVPSRSLLRVWIADNYGGAPSGAVDTIIWDVGTVVETVDSNSHYVVATDSNGVASARLIDGSSSTVYWGAARGAVVYYSGPIYL